VDTLQDFEHVSGKRIESRYGRAPAHRIDLDSLIAFKSGIDHPRHPEERLHPEDGQGSEKRGEVFDPLRSRRPSGVPQQRLRPWYREPISTAET
jgi:hypothetical protein